MCFVTISRASSALRKLSQLDVRNGAANDRRICMEDGESEACAVASAEAASSKMQKPAGEFARIMAAEYEASADSKGNPAGFFFVRPATAAAAVVAAPHNSADWVRRCKWALAAWA